jgi:predicted AAA+ superfamily ATPase
MYGESKLSLEQIAYILTRGGWPAAVGEKNEKLALLKVYDYLEAVVNEDISRVDKVDKNPDRVRSLIRSLSRNISTEASLETLAAEAGIEYAGLSVPTVRKYLDQLTRIFVLEELPAWSDHIRSSIRMRVKPKWHFVDPSLATAALGATTPILMNDLSMLGLLFESMAIRDLRVYADAIDAKVFHYRDSTDLEIDAIIERRDGIWAAIEIKLGSKKAIEEAAANFTKLRNRLTAEKQATLAMCAIVTAGEFSYIRKDGVAVIALGHLGAPIESDDDFPKSI